MCEAVSGGAIHELDKNKEGRFGVLFYLHAAKRRKKSPHTGIGGGEADYSAQVRADSWASR
jgi:hypothetical protein